MGIKTLRNERLLYEKICIKVCLMFSLHTYIYIFDFSFMTSSCLWTWLIQKDDKDKNFDYFTWKEHVTDLYDVLLQTSWTEKTSLKIYICVKFLLVVKLNCNLSHPSTPYCTEKDGIFTVSRVSFED